MEGLIICLTVILVIKILSTIKLEKINKNMEGYTMIQEQEFKNNLNKLSQNLRRRNYN